MTVKYISHGTCHFVSLAAAVRYYGTKETVNHKISEGEIRVGYPDVKEGDKVSINDEGRYFIKRLDPSSVKHYDTFDQAMEANPNGIFTATIIRQMIRRGEIVIKSA
ncbi:hypothetical protein F418_p60 [Hafnia phage Enc34]|uniref:Uncharacterized protein n=1 Tax=Hafnia phage Enc34 TaxID=1150990 RepID=H6WYM2_9CAUD|nr:hypothetical protein F418_p60 [Hafnia phage Enc34]AFB84077.1 hypothetical protein [Hafnia phage Enc34]